MKNKNVCVCCFLGGATTKKNPLYVNVNVSVGVKWTYPETYVWNWANFFGYIMLKKATHTHILHTTN